MKLLMGGAGRAGRAESASHTGRDVGVRAAQAIVGQVGVRAAPAIVGQVRRAEKNGKAGKAGRAGRIGEGLSRIFFWVLVGN